MRSVCFLALFLCVAGSPRIQTPQDPYVCHTWNNRESGKDYCCLQSCEPNQQQLFWCYVRDPQNQARYCSPPDTQTHEGIPCHDNHACGHDATAYSWCYTDARRSWAYCSVKECGTERTCYVDSAGEVRLPEWAVHLYSPCDTSRRTKRGVTDEFSLKHIIKYGSKWQRIDNADKSEVIRKLLIDHFKKSKLTNRYKKEYNTFINLVDKKVREQFYEKSNNVTQSTAVGTNMGNYHVVTFRYDKDKELDPYSRDREKSGYKAVFVQACKKGGMVDHYHDRDGE